MLEELRIRNFAVIDALTLTFGAGLNVITGETGAGKSILIDAVELLLGGRADPAFVRAGSDRSIIEGVVSLDGRVRDSVKHILEADDLLDPDEPDYLTLYREVRRRGRSTARINGVAVRADRLRDIGALLFDIHGQSEHLSLFRTRNHIDLLDRYADLLDIRAALANLVDQLSRLQSEIIQLRDDKEGMARRAELLRHEVDEITAAALNVDEEAGLAAERVRLANSEQLAELAHEAAQRLDGDERGAIVDGLMAVSLALSKLAEIDPQAQEDYQLAESLSSQAQELALTMTRYASDVEQDPRRLDDVEERLELIRGLKRRFNASSIVEILDYAARAQEELEGIESGDERLHALQRREDQLLRQIGDISGRLSRERHSAGHALSAAIVRELGDLRMEAAQFEVALARAEHPAGCIVGERRYKFDAKGMDDVEFMLSANPGQPALPLAKVASGGEAARIMLSLKRALTEADQTPVLIFDEVDQGIGGRVGATVGQKLWALSAAHQVFCVTHLPQLAAFADRHLRAQKAEAGSTVATRVEALEDDAARINELAEMLGAPGAAGMESARGLLESARGWKRL